MWTARPPYGIKMVNSAKKERSGKVSVFFGKTNFTAEEEATAEPATETAEPVVAETAEVAETTDAE